jgi:predicted ATPase
MAPRRTTQSTGEGEARLGSFLRSVTLLRDDVPDLEKYPFSIPSIRQLESLEFHPEVTFLVGENGSGKSTLIEALAVAAGFNAEGGSQNFRFSTRPSESELHRHLRLARGIRRPKSGFFLRAESFFNVATEIDNLDAAHSYGGQSLHEKSHGEAFLALVNHRFGPDGLYLLDEPEAALSPQRQLALLRAIHELTGQRCQFIIATHSPILLAFPRASIHQLSEDGLAPIAYEDTEHYRLTRDFLLNRERYLARLFAPD